MDNDLRFPLAPARVSYQHCCTLCSISKQADMFPGPGIPGLGPSCPGQGPNWVQYGFNKTKGINDLRNKETHLPDRMFLPDWFRTESSSLNYHLDKICLVGFGFIFKDDTIRVPAPFLQMISRSSLARPRPLWAILDSLGADLGSIWALMGL